jgi:ankyrin repeat protein
MVVEGGYTVVVKLLLDKGKVKADLKDKNRRILLLMAVEGGHNAVVKLLLAYSKAEANLKDKGK